MMTPEEQQRLADQRKAARRARGQGRHWYLRAAVMVLVACFGLYRGGQLNNIIGVVLIVLAMMAVSLGRQLRKQADAMETKIDLMERGTGDRGQGTAGA